jgi:hypothetical protein
MPALRNLTGERFGRLAVKSFAGKDKHGRSTWLCRCDCGRKTTVEMSQLVTGRTQSCGCLKQEILAQRSTKHGHAQRVRRSAEYRSWCAMHTRCHNEKSQDYPEYGGRGITVCQRWGKFENFLADMGRKPSPKHTLERTKTNGDYEPSNCCWAIPLVQANNTRSNRLIHLPDGRVQTFAQAAREIGWPYMKFWYRVRFAERTMEIAKRQVAPD